MHISEKYIQQYMRLYEHDFGKPISTGQALVELTALVELMHTVNHYLCKHPEEAEMLKAILINEHPLEKRQEWE